MIKKFFGFTLGEILIALGVIGVVASLTLPQIINGKKASEAHAQFTTAYAIISQAIDAIETDNISIKPANYISTKNSFFPVAKQYFKITQFCGEQSSSGETFQHSACPSKDSTYKEFGKSTSHISNLLSSTAGTTSVVIDNGMWIAFTNRGAAADDNYKPIFITVDINGANKLPNRYGYDLFTFQLTNNGILPEGAPGTVMASSVDTYCDPDSNTSMNGWTCAAKAVTNPDYFKELYKGH